MKLSLRIALSLAALAPFAAHSADYDSPIFVEEAAEYVPVEVGSGWYLRGDVGYVFDKNIDGVDYTFTDPISLLEEPASFTSASIDTDFTWGGGFGYRFTDYFRADATVDGFRADFNGSTASDETCALPDDDTTCRSENSSEVSAISVMANGYVDLGTYVGITPYVGAGLGYSFVSWSDLNDTTFCVDGADPCVPPGAAVDSTTHGGEDGWRFTYALMAGFAYDLSNNFKLDVGYKYRSIDGGDMFGWDSPGTFGDGSHGKIDTHEVRLGLRYELW
jgi:opacity protein-like surface antigen